MDALKNYNIPYKGLKEGKHKFSFTIEDGFFDLFEVSEIKKGRLITGLELVKRSTFLELEFHIKGKVEVMCDRCLDLFYLPVTCKNKLYVKFGLEKNDAEDMIILSHQDFEINIAQYIFEFIYLNLPIKRIHPNTENNYCNEQMLRLLQQHKPAEEEKTDPRWDQLKRIIDKLN